MVILDYEYKRFETILLLVDIDIPNGVIIPLVSATYRSADFINWVKRLDGKYPEQGTFRFVLDNRPSHTLKET